MFTNRVGLAVWVYSLKQTKQLKRFGLIHYISRKMKYVIIYCDVDRLEETKKRIEALSFVKEIEVSERPWIKTEYQNLIPEKEKKDDYKMGI